MDSPEPAPLKREQASLVEAQAKFLEFLEVLFAVQRQSVKAGRGCCQRAAGCAGEVRGLQDRINTRILLTVVSGIPLVLGPRTRL